MVLLDSFRLMDYDAYMNNNVVSFSKSGRNPFKGTRFVGNGSFNKRGNSKPKGKK